METCSLSQFIILQLWKENSSTAQQWPMSPLQMCVLTTLRKLTKCTKIKEMHFFLLLQPWIGSRCTANIHLIGTYLLIISRNQQGVRGDMKKKESKHIISWLRQDIRKTSCYNLLLCFFMLTWISREYTSWKVGGLFFITLGTILLYCSSEKILSSTICCCETVSNRNQTSSPQSNLCMRVPRSVSHWHDFTDKRLRPLTGHSSRVGSSLWMRLYAAFRHGPGQRLGKESRLDSWIALCPWRAL